MRDPFEALLPPPNLLRNLLDRFDPLCLSSHFWTRVTSFAVVRLPTPTGWFPGKEVGARAIGRNMSVIVKMAGRESMIETLD